MSTMNCVVVFVSDNKGMANVQCLLNICLFEHLFIYFLFFVCLFICLFVCFFFEHMFIFFYEKLVLLSYQQFEDR